MVGGQMESYAQVCLLSSVKFLQGLHFSLQVDVLRIIKGKFKYLIMR